MKTYEEFLESIIQNVNYERILEIDHWVLENFSRLKREIKWNQLMYTMDGTYILGISVSKNHISIGPEHALFDQFKPVIEAKGYQTTKVLFQVKKKEEVHYELLTHIITQTMHIKEGYKKFWLSQ